MSCRTDARQPIGITPPARDDSPQGSGLALAHPFSAIRSAKSPTPVHIVLGEARRGWAEKPGLSTTTTCDLGIGWLLVWASRQDTSRRPGLGTLHDIRFRRGRAQ